MKKNKPIKNNHGYIGIEAIILTAVVILIGLTSLNVLYSDSHVGFRETVLHKVQLYAGYDPATLPESHKPILPEPQAPYERPIPIDTVNPVEPEPEPIHYVTTPETINQMPVSTGWTSDGNGNVGSSSGILLANNTRQSYTLSIVASVGRGNILGFGVIFEATVGTNNVDTGYVIELSRCTRQVVLRHRVNGEDGPIVHTAPAPMIPNNMGSNWWTNLHEFKVQVVKPPGTENIKLVTFFIDNVKLFENVQITVPDSQTESLAGIRAGKSYTVSESITIY